MAAQPLAVPAQHLAQVGGDRAPADVPLFITVLGSFGLFLRGLPLISRSRPKVEALLIYLSLRKGEWVAKSNLLGYLWPDAEGELANQCLKSLLRSVQNLGRNDGISLIDQRGPQLRLNRDGGVSVDIDRFESLCIEADAQSAAGQATAAMDSYRRAVTLYRGDIVGADDDLQALIERERLRAAFLKSLTRLADHYFASGEYDKALQTAFDLLHRDPCREDAHRLTMRCFVRLGIRSQALRQFRLCETIMRAEFGVEPEDDTVLLFQQVKSSPRSV
jgi:DNA-binding SARP family transcriptional activator